MSQTLTAQALQSTDAAQALPAPSAAVRYATMMLRLYQLAESSANQYIDEAGRYLPMDDTMLGSDLYKLAAETTWRSLILRKELLHVFCEPAAAKLLLRLPNRYWFWTTIKTAIMQVEEDALHKPLTAEHVALALAEIRCNASGKYDLRAALSELSKSQVASRASAGVILARSGCGELDELVLNPIFAPCPGTDGNLAQSAAALTATLLKN